MDNSPQNNDVIDVDPAPLAPVEGNQPAPLALIERMMLNPEVDAEKLQQLLNVQEQWEAGEARKAFARALAKFQAECPPVFKGKTVKGRINYNYAAKQDIERTIRPHMASNGLAVSIYRSQMIDGKLVIEGSITHRDGHSQPIGGEVSIDRSMSCNDTQKVGSASSYAWRYIVCPALGISLSDERDDDGHLAGTGALISEEQAQELFELISASETDEKKFLAFYQVEKLEELPASKFTHAKKMLQKKLQGGGA